jgi:hypothetical protein
MEAVSMRRGGQGETVQASSRVYIALRNRIVFEIEDAITCDGTIPAYAYTASVSEKSKDARHFGPIKPRQYKIEAQNSTVSFWISVRAFHARPSPRGC